MTRCGWLAGLACASMLAIAGGRAQTAAAPDEIDPRISRLLAEVSEDRLRALLARLVSFETRHTMSAPDSPARGIGAARQWILDELTRASPRLQTSFETYRLPPQGERLPREVELRNVVAILPGRSPRRIYVSAHYDTVARLARPGPATPGDGFDWSAGDNPAPGANDDGSGTVLTMELARVLAGSGLDFDATIVFICFAGEEQGLVGATLHAQRAEAEKVPIDAVFNNDIVGNAAGGQGIADGESVRVFSEGPEDSPSRQVARYVRRQAARYIPSHRVVLIARPDRFGRGGDHTAFNQHGFAAVRITEANENYGRQHTVEDTLEGVSFAYLARNTRVNLAAVASLALAPAAPAVSDSGRPLLDRGASGYDARLRWRRSNGAIRYRIVWRESWTPDWEHALVVGDVDEVVLPHVSIDDYVFGVVAIGPGGHESVVSAYVNPPRGRAEFRTTGDRP